MNANENSDILKVPVAGADSWKEVRDNHTNYRPRDSPTVTDRICRVLYDTSLIQLLTDFCFYRLNSHRNKN